MGRRKECRIPLRELSCYERLLEMLNSEPVFGDFDVTASLLVMKGRRALGRIRDVDRVIGALQRYIEENEHLVPTYCGQQIVRRSHLAGILGVSRPTLNQWISYRFIVPEPLRYLAGETFPLALVLRQLYAYKSLHG